MTGKLIVLIAILAVAAVLCLGLYTLWVGNETTQTKTNKQKHNHILAQTNAKKNNKNEQYFSQHG